jgi:cation transport ATPase
MADDLSKLPVALQASRPRLRIIKQNVAFSLLVIANGLRARHISG